MRRSHGPNDLESAWRGLGPIGAGDLANFRKEFNMAKFRP